MGGFVFFIVVCLIIDALDKWSEKGKNNGANGNAEYSAPAPESIDYAAIEKARYEAAQRATQERMRRSIEDHNALVSAARANPNSSYSDRMYW